MYSTMLLAVLQASVSVAGDEIETITVEAAKVPTAAAEITSSVTLIDDSQIEREVAQTLQDLVRYEPGVDVVDQGSRFGLSGISIRGIGGNRVKMEVDGVPTSDAFSIGSFSNASRDFVDIDSLKQVEIVRGPASAVFGSDALGGVVSFVTKSPHDVLGEANRRFGVSAGFNSVDSSRQLSLTGATRVANVAAILRASIRQGHERDGNLVDPLDDDSHNILLRFAWGEYGNGALDVSLEQFRANSDTAVDSREGLEDFTAAFGFPYTVNTTAVAAEDERERNRISIGQEWLSGRFGADYLRWRIYSQDSATRQDTFEARDTIVFGVPGPVERERTFRFEQELLGFELNASSDWSVGDNDYRLAYGVEYERTDTDQIRDGQQIDLLTGGISKQVGPDTYPVRDFPVSRTKRIGSYLQATVDVGALTMLPGIRWDRYELDPRPDAIFMEDNPGTVTTPLSTEKISPKLGLLWNVANRMQLYAQYAEGFRAPPVNDVNVGFTNFQFGYTALPNPDLRSESSEGLELGIRYRGEQVQMSVAGFRTEYDDFIQSFQVVGFDPQTQLLQFQSINIDAVKIEGIEFQSNFALPVLADQLSFSFAVAYANGINLSNGGALNSVAPLNAVLGLDFQSASRQWGGSFLIRGAEQQDDLDESDGELLSPAGFIVFDTHLFWKPSESTRVRAGLYNLTDHQYTAYLDVQGIAADSTVADRFRQPGRHASIAFDWTF